MRTTSTPRLAAERLAEEAGWSVKDRILDTGELQWVQDSWLRVLGYVVDLMTHPKGLGMGYREVWELCRFETRPERIKGETWYTVSDNGWPSLVIARMLRESDAVRSKEVAGVVIV